MVSSDGDPLHHWSIVVRHENPGEVLPGEGGHLGKSCNTKSAGKKAVLGTTYLGRLSTVFSLMTVVKFKDFPWLQEFLVENLFSVVKRNRHFLVQYVT